MKKLCMTPAGLSFGIACMAAAAQQPLVKTKAGHLVAAEDGR